MSQINFTGSAKGTENLNPGRTPNTREEPVLLLRKLLGFALHFFIFKEGVPIAQWPPSSVR